MASERTPPEGIPRQEAIPLHEEVLSVGKRAVERGRLRVTTAVHERDESVDQDLESETLEVVRVPVGRPVELAPAPRQDGDVLILPVLEEQLVVTKRLILKEELHIHKRTVRRTERVTATLRSEEAVVVREDPSGSPTPTPQE